MINIRLVSRRTARNISRGGFTLVELLVVIGIIAILAGVALGPITSGIEKAKESSGLQVTRSINLLLFSYANDNNQTYLPGSGSANPQATAITTGHGIANALLNAKYASDPSIFAITTAHKYTGTVSSGYNLLAGNVDFNFTAANSSGTGLTSAACDQVPMVWSVCSATAFTGYPTAAITSSIPIGVDNTGAFSLNGLAVAYKSNSAAFLKATATSPTAASAPNFIQASYSDTTQYSQVSP